jgi:hypothetical protein
MCWRSPQVQRLSHPPAGLAAAAGKVFNLALVADQRARAQPKLPAGAFGNWIMSLPTTKLQASSASLGTLAAALRREVQAAASSFYNECAWLREQVGLLRRAAHLEGVWQAREGTEGREEERAPPGCH